MPQAADKSLLFATLIREAAERRRACKLRAAKASKARENLLDFIEYTKADYVADRFHREVCRIFQQFFEDVLAGKRPRVVLSAPPQHGKSEIVSRRFPIWALGKVPKLRLICASYNSTLAQELQGHRIHTLISPEYRDVFPDVTVTTRRSDLVRVTAGGHMIASGTDQGITGRSADIGIIDDPIKGYAEAVSETVRESIWNWYRTDFYSRLQKGGGVIVMMTRWHQDDLVGRLLESDADAWQVYNFPALAEAENDLLGRQPGEPLARERFDEPALAAIQKVQGTYAWGALYQGHPSPAEGLLLKRDYWRYYGTGDLPEFDLIALSLDAAFKDTADSDHVALHIWGFVGPRGYLLDRTCERMGYTATKEEAKRLARKWHAQVLLIEDKANGSAVIEELSRTMGSEASILPISPAGGKLARAWPFSADLEAGNAWLPLDQPWAGDIVEYAAKFPTSPMDHDIDAMTQAFNWRRENLHGLLVYYKSEFDRMAEAQQKKAIAKVQTSLETPRCPECGSLAIRELSSITKKKRCNQCGLEFGAIPDEDVDYLGTSRGALLNDRIV